MTQSAVTPEQAFAAAREPLKRYAVSLRERIRATLESATGLQMVDAYVEGAEHETAIGVVLSDGQREFYAGLTPYQVTQPAQTELRISVPVAARMRAASDIMRVREVETLLS